MSRSAFTHRLTLGACMLLVGLGIGTTGAHAAVESVALTTTSQETSAVSDYTFTVSFEEDFGGGGGGDPTQEAVDITFPASYDLSIFQYCGSSCISSPDSRIGGASIIGVVDNTVSLYFTGQITGNVIDASENEELVFTMSAIQNPHNIGTQTIEITRPIYAPGTGSATDTVTTTSGLTVDNVVVSNTTPGATGVDYTIFFETPTELYNGHPFVISFPKGTNLDNVDDNSDISLDYSDPTYNPSLNGISFIRTIDNHLFISIGSSITTGPGSLGKVALTVSDVTNSAVAGNYTLGVSNYTYFDVWNLYDSRSEEFGGFHSLTIGAPTGAISAETATSTNVAINTTNNTYTISFNYAGDLESGDAIRLSFPDNIDISNVDNAGVTLTAAGITKGVAAVSGQILTVPVDSGAFSDGLITIAIAGVNNPTAQAGLYNIDIQVLDDTNAVVAAGMASISFGSVVQVSALVTEALILTLGNTQVFLDADPLNPNGGIDRSQFTELTVHSNSKSGYLLSALLQGGALTHQDPTVASNGGVIPTGTGDKTFGYHATNAPHDSGHTFVGEYGFGSTNAETLTASGGGNIGHNDVADPVVHTVYYDLDVNFLTPAGTYTGLIYYTVTAAF